MFKYVLLSIQNLNIFELLWIYSVLEPMLLINNSYNYTEKVNIFFVSFAFGVYFYSRWTSLSGLKTRPTRMHSSRMRTARSSSHPGGGLHQAHPPPEQTPLHPGAVPLGADTPPSRHPPGPDHPPPLTESQMPVKILPCPNFVVGGNKAEFNFLGAFCECTAIALTDPRPCRESNEKI